MDPVTDRDPGDRLADLDHGAGTLVAEDHRQRIGQTALADQQVAVAHPGRVDAQAHIARTEARWRQLLDRERLFVVSQHRCTHEPEPPEGQ